MEDSIIHSLAGVLRDLLKSWREKILDGYKSDPYIPETVVQEPSNVKTYLLSGSWPEFFNTVIFPAMRSSEEVLFDSFKSDIKEMLVRHERHCADQLQENTLSEKKVNASKFDLDFLLLSLFLFLQPLYAGFQASLQFCLRVGALLSFKVFRQRVIVKENFANFHKI